jgi:hypothetical protein
MTLLDALQGSAETHGMITAA